MYIICLIHIMTLPTRYVDDLRIPYLLLMFGFYKKNKQCFEYHTKNRSLKEFDLCKIDAFVIAKYFFISTFSLINNKLIT